jgi:hypothetical protein
VKTISEPRNEKEACYAREKEACKKDVEWPFGGMQARWAIIRHSARTWSLKIMWKVMTACDTMHDMIVEGEGAQQFEGYGVTYRGL